MSGAEGSRRRVIGGNREVVGWGKTLPSAFTEWNPQKSFWQRIKHGLTRPTIRSTI